MEKGEIISCTQDRGILQVYILASARKLSPTTLNCGTARRPHSHSRHGARNHLSLRKSGSTALSPLGVRDAVPNGHEFQKATVRCFVEEACGDNPQRAGGHPKSHSQAGIGQQPAEQSKDVDPRLKESFLSFFKHEL